MCDHERDISNKGGLENLLLFIRKNIFDYHHSVLNWSFICECFYVVKYINVSFNFILLLFKMLL